VHFYGAKLPRASFQSSLDFFGGALWHWKTDAPLNGGKPRPNARSESRLLSKPFEDFKVWLRARSAFGNPYEENNREQFFGDFLNSSTGRFGGKN